MRERVRAGFYNMLENVRALSMNCAIKVRFSAAALAGNMNKRRNVAPIL